MPRKYKTNRVGRPPGVTKVSEERVRAAILKHRGCAFVVCKALGISEPTFYEYLRRWPELNEVLRFARELELDKAESALFRAVDNGEAWSVCFLLKTRGRERGYSEKLDLTVGTEQVKVVETVVRSRQEAREILRLNAEGKLGLIAPPVDSSASSGEDRSENEEMGPPVIGEAG
jgi:hypothetical protein